jgi:hypothetical protein
MDKTTSGNAAPPKRGDSWRPAVAGLLAVAPLAVAAGAFGASLMGGISATSPQHPTYRHADASPAQECVTTVTSGALGQLKYPACYGD